MKKQKKKKKYLFLFCLFFYIKINSPLQIPDNPGFSTASSITLNITKQRYNCIFKQIFELSKVLLCL